MPAGPPKFPVIRSCFSTGHDVTALFAELFQKNLTRRTYPRYFKLEFGFHRAKYKAQPRPINPAKVELQAQVIELHSKGWSFPAIAKHLDISVGTAWNMAKLTN